MATQSYDFLIDWVRLTLSSGNNIRAWAHVFDFARTEWQLDLARRLLYEAKRVTLAPPEMARVHYGEGILLGQLGDWSRAVECHKHAVELLEDTEHVTLGIKVLNDLGMILRLQGNYEGAKAAHNQSLSLAEAIDDTELVIEALNHIGLDLEHHDKFTEAIPYFRKALDHCETLDDQVEIARVLNHLGEIYWRTGELSAAQSALEKARRLLQARDREGVHTYLLTQIEANLGNIHNERGELDTAEAHYQAALASFDTMNVLFDKVGILNSLGGLSFKRQDYSTAHHFFEASLALAQELGDERGIKEAAINIGLTLHKTGELEIPSTVLTNDNHERP